MDDRAGPGETEVTGENRGQVAEFVSPDEPSEDDVMYPVTIYRSRPQHAEAVQWTGYNETQLYGTFGSKVRIVGVPLKLELLAGANGAQGWVPVPLGHWLVNKVDDLSDIWPVDPDYFASKYEVA
jgi:hypothetical protein